MPFVDSDVTGSISGAGFRATGLGAVASAARAAWPTRRRREPHQRAEKRARIVNVAKVAPPKAFNAGSILQRSSMLLRPAIEPEQKMAFVKSDIKGKEIKIATAFYVPRRRSPIRRFPPRSRPRQQPDGRRAGHRLCPAGAGLCQVLALRQPAARRAGNVRALHSARRARRSCLDEPAAAASVFDAGEQKCLATAIYFEARGENLRGQAAVAQVVLNRVRNPTYPKTICGVVYQNQHWRNRCQFSFACDGRKDVITSRSSYKMARSRHGGDGGKIFIPEVASSTHYYAQYVSPGWGGR